MIILVDNNMGVNNYNIVYYEINSNSILNI